MAKRNSTKPNGSRIPAVGYIRMSTDKQEDSPEQQRAEILKLASRHGYRIVRWYEDHAISGAKTLKRKQFRQMIRDAEELGDFKAILCWDQDRFGRFDSIEAGEWISPLRRVGVELVTVTQGRINWEDFAGRMIYQITQEGKHHYLVDLSRNALRGMIRFAKKGNLLGMPTPYGYDRVYFNAAGKEMCRIRRGEKFRKPRDWTAKLVPSEDKQAVKTIRWLFKTFAETDCSARSLAVELNKRGVPSPNGGEWEYTHIKNLLRHPVYIGWLTYGRRRAGLYHHVGEDGELVSSRDNAGDSGQYAPIVVADNHEALVNQATFDAVQAKLKARSKVPGGPYRKYLLSGILRCGHCGSIMVGAGQGGGATGHRFTYYKCKRSRVSGTCNNYAVRTELIEEALTEHFRAVWLSPAGQKALRKAIKKVGRERDRDRPNRVKEFETRLADLDRQIRRGTENLLLVDAGDIPDLKRILDGWREERDAVQASLEAERTSDAASPELDADGLLAELDHLEEHLASDCVVSAKAAFSRIFKSVKLFWKQVSPRRRELERAEIETHFPFV